MNWDAIGAVGEIVGAFAVVVSLVYLASQLKTQNRESGIASVHEITEAFRHSITALQEKDRAEVVVAAMTGFDDLAPARRLQFISMTQGVLRVWEEAFYRHREGRLEEQAWVGMLAQWTDYIAMDGARKVWALRRHTYRADFRAFVDSIEGGEYQI